MSNHDLNQLRADIRRAHRIPEQQLVPALMELANCDAVETAHIKNYALRLIAAVRSDASNHTGPWITELLREYPLNTSEGLALMGLAEACLRVPDTYTRRLLIRDKLTQRTWHRSTAMNEPPKSWLVRLSTYGLMLSGNLLTNAHSALLRRFGEPIIGRGVMMAMRLIGNQFVFGKHINAALKRAQHRELSCSFDMLGEAARTAADAQRYLIAYQHAIDAVGAEVRSGHALLGRYSISIKLSALHPRYEPLQAKHAVPALLAQLRMLARSAMHANIGLTIDAEESDRLEMSLDIIEQLLATPELYGWQGLSIAVQAYQKRALPVINWLNAVGQRHQCRIGVRLVKGAYWDMEIKRCQERGLSDFPVFTRKSSTDVSYLACARQLLASSHLAPAFATHNAHTIATLLAWLGTRRDVEFQRLHGMGASMYKYVAEDHGIPCRVYAPVGRHQELLPYLIRRMLENSSNNGFIQQLSNPAISAETLIESPVQILHRTGFDHHPVIQAPAQLFGLRRNSAGLDLFDPNALNTLNMRMQPFLARRSQSSSSLAPTSDASISSRDFHEH